MKQLVVIPVYNEEATIRQVISELCRHYQGDILIVNDGSVDRSMENISCCIEECPIAVINHEINLGYGKSLIDGFNFAIQNNYQTLVTMDCDCQHQPKHVVEFFNFIGDADVLSGSRYLHQFEQDTDAPAERKNVNQIITQKINDITHYNLTDSFCGFKSYKVEALAKLELDEYGYAFPMQFWIQAYTNNLVIKELAIPRIYTGAARSFGAKLDDSGTRLHYYLEVIEHEKKRCKIN